MSENPLDKFFDKADEILDRYSHTKGKLGVVPLATTDHNDKPMLVWHVARYRMGLACDSGQEYRLESFKEKLPKGGHFPFCRKCLNMALESIDD